LTTTERSAKQSKASSIGRPNGFLGATSLYFEWQVRENLLQTVSKSMPTAKVVVSSTD